MHKLSNTTEARSLLSCSRPSSVVLGHPLLHDQLRSVLQQVLVGHSLRRGALRLAVPENLTQRLKSLGARLAAGLVH